MKLFPLHMWIWLLKLSVVFLLISPVLKDFFHTAYISELLLQFNIHGVYDIFTSGLLPHVYQSAIIVCLVSIVLFCIHSVFEAGFLGSYMYGDTNRFWLSAKQYGKKTLLINILTFFPTVCVYTLMIFIFNYARDVEQSGLALLLVSSSLIFLFYMIKGLYITKLHYVLNKSSFSHSLRFGLSQIPKQKKRTWSLHLFSSIVLSAFLYQYTLVEHLAQLKTTEWMIAFVALQQLFVFIKQLGSYIYYGSLISFNQTELHSDIILEKPHVYILQK